MLSVRKYLLIGAPILSRVYQELETGMLSYTRAKIVSHVPFPFPLTQVIYYCLYIFLVLCPFIVRASLDEPEPNLIKTWSMLALNFFLCAGYACLNEIAVELEQPFGHEANNWPLHVQHWRIDADLEDMLHAPTPHDTDECSCNWPSLSSLSKTPIEQALGQTGDLLEELHRQTEAMRDLHKAHRESLPSLHKRLAHIEVLCASRDARLAPAERLPQELVLQDQELVRCSGEGGLLSTLDLGGHDASLATGGAVSSQEIHGQRTAAGMSLKGPELRELLRRSMVVNRRLQDFLASPSCCSGVAPPRAVPPWLRPLDMDGLLMPAQMQTQEVPSQAASSRGACCAPLTERHDWMCI